MIWVYNSRYIYYINMIPFYIVSENQHWHEKTRFKGILGWLSKKIKLAQFKIIFLYKTFILFRFKNVLNEISINVLIYIKKIELRTINWYKSINDFCSIACTKLITCILFDWYNVWNALELHTIYLYLAIYM